MPVADVTKRIRYYVSSPDAGTLTVIDGSTNNIIQTYTVGIGATQIALSKDNTAYIASSTNDSVSILCFEGGIRTLSIPNNGFLDVDGSQGKVYVSNISTVNVYNTASGLLVGSIPGFKHASFLKLTPDRSKLLVIDGQLLNIYSTDTLSLIRSINIGGDPVYLLITADSKKVFVSNNGDSTVSAIDLVNFIQIATIPLDANAKPQGLAIKDTILYVANTGINEISLINTVTYELLPTNILTTEPVRLAMTPDNTKLLATNKTGSITIIDTITRTVDGSIGLSSTPFDVKAAYFGSPESPGDPIDSYQLEDITESVCILVNKVFAHCQSRDCQGNVTITPPENVTFTTVDDVIFGNGVIDKSSLVISQLAERPNFSRVQLTINVPVTIKYNKGETLTTTLIPIQKDIVMFMPKTRDEFNFDIVLETRTELLNTPIIDTGNIEFAAGIFIVIKVTGQVQLLIPAFGYCPEPPECENFVGNVTKENVCEAFLDFTQTPFPEDFFPPQYEDINCQL